MKFRNFVAFILVVFSLNFLWEIGQTPLYAPHFDSLWDLILVHLRAAGGDAIMIAVIIFINALIFRDWLWFFKLNKKKIMSIVIWGAAMAIAIEKAALLSSRWNYNDLMPIIPILNVGLTPVLQMIILSVLSFWINGKFSNQR